MDALWGLLGIVGFFSIIYFLEQRRLNKPLDGRGLPEPAKRYHNALGSLLAPYASASFAKELLEKAYDSIKSDYEAYQKGERSDYLATLFDDEYADTPREDCWAICFTLECISLPGGNTETAIAAREFLERQRKRIASMAKYALEHNTAFPDGIVNYSQQAQYAIQYYNNEESI